MFLDDYDDEEIEFDISGKNMWAKVSDNTFTPVDSAIKKLQPGFYEIILNHGLYFQRVETNDELLIDLESDAYRSVIKDIESFWKMKKKFTEHSLTYKRGILLYGPPGTGKSCLARLLIDGIAKKGGIGIKFNGVHHFVTGMRALRKISPKMPVIVLMEDLDSLIFQEDESSLLNMLDGIYKIDNVVYLATTNNPEQLHERISNRPSRFDRRIEVGLPSFSARKEYIKNLNRANYLKEKDILAYANDSDGMTYAHIRELFVSTVILEKEYEESLKELRLMNIKLE